MARRKKKTGLQALLESVSLKSLLLHPATLFVMLNMVLGVIAIQCWERFQHHIVDEETTRLTADRINLVTAPPAWAKTDLKQTILSSAPDSTSLLDHGVVADAVNAFRSVGWIEQVRSVKKTREGLDIDLIYRQPVAVVELRGGKGRTVQGWDDSTPARLVPIDRNGFVLPDSLAFEGPAIPVIGIYHGDAHQPGVPLHLRQLYPWTPWPDERIKQAASLSEILRHDWQEMGLHRIATWRTFSDADNAAIPYQLWTAKGQTSAIVIWGSPPEFESQNEAPWRQKIIALREFVRQNGPLDQLSERVIDLRSGHAVQLTQSASLQYRGAKIH